MTKEQYEQKKQARIDRLNARAAKAEQASIDFYNESNKAVEHIPMGQPILVGHHSEKAHRNALQRSWNKMDKSVAESNKAEYYKEKAIAAENNNAISSDDPEAVQKLKEKIKELEKLQEHMRKVNKAHAKYSKTQDVSVLKEFNEYDKKRIMIYVPAYSWEPHPYAPYQLSNNNANIRTCKKRLEQLEANQNQESSEQQFGEITLIENVELNRIQLKFPGKPHYETRSKLKSYGFRWSPYNMAWQRHLNNSGRYAAESVIKAINQA